MKGGNKMKANELRIGNFVATEGIDFVEVSKIDADFGICYKIPQEFGQFYPYKEVEPIPLTEEWLMRFGFKPFSKDFQKNGVIIHTRKRGFVVNTKNSSYKIRASTAKFILCTSG